MRLCLLALPIAAVAAPGPEVLAPPAPAILSPAHGAALRDQSSVKFSWAAVTGASRYDIALLALSSAGAPIGNAFQGTNAADATSISLPNLVGNYRFAVRACDASGCGPASSVDFNHVFTGSGSPGGVFPGPVVILSPTLGQVLTSSTHQFRWDPAQLATRYMVKIKPPGNAAPEMQIVTRSLSTIYTLRGLPEYELQVTPCSDFACSTPTSVAFSTNFPPIPTGAPTITSGNALSGNSYRFDWTAVPGADVYRIQVVQPTSGPGGGALTVASTQTAVTNVTLSVPAGAASALVAAAMDGVADPTRRHSRSIRPDRAPWRRSWGNRSPFSTSMVRSCCSPGTACRETTDPTPCTGSTHRTCRGTNRRSTC